MSKPAIKANLYTHSHLLEEWVLFLTSQGLLIFTGRHFFFFFFYEKVIGKYLFKSLNNSPRKVRLWFFNSIIRHFVRMFTKHLLINACTNSYEITPFFSISFNKKKKAWNWNSLSFRYSHIVRAESEQELVKWNLIKKLKKTDL